MIGDTIYFNGGRFEQTSPGVYSEQGQLALSDDVTWVQQPAFEKAFADLTGTEPPSEEWRRETRWSFTGDDESYAQ